MFIVSTNSEVESFAKFVHLDSAGKGLILVINSISVSMNFITTNKNARGFMKKSINNEKVQLQLIGVITRK